MSPLYTTVPLVQVNNVSVIITKELDLDMFRLVKETLNEDCSVPESGLGPEGWVRFSLLGGRFSSSLL